MIFPLHWCDHNFALEQYDLGILYFYHSLEPCFLIWKFVTYDNLVTLIVFLLLWIHKMFANQQSFFLSFF